MILALATINKLHINLQKMLKELSISLHYEKK